MFLRGIVRVIPYIVPIAIVAVLVLSYFAYMGLRLFNHRRKGGPLEVRYLYAKHKINNKYQVKVKNENYRKIPRNFLKARVYFHSP